MPLQGARRRQLVKMRATQQRSHQCLTCRTLSHCRCPASSTTCRTSCSCWNASASFLLVGSGAAAIISTAAWPRLSSTLTASVSAPATHSPRGPSLDNPVEALLHFPQHETSRTSARYTGVHHFALCMPIAWESYKTALLSNRGCTMHWHHPDVRCWKTARSPAKHQPPAACHMLVVSYAVNQ